MEKELELKHIVNGEIVNFPNDNERVVIRDFSYNAQRMGAAPTINAIVMHTLCLDSLWNNSVFTEFNGEKFFLLSTPSSSKGSDDARYKHDIQLVSERVILDNVYFYDVVSEGFDDSKPVSNSTKVFFFGNVSQFAKRLNESMKYAKVGYNVVVDDSALENLDGKLITFEKQFLSNALQEVYSTFNVPFYFVGKTIHIGKYQQNETLETTIFKYGAEDNLLSVSKSNENNKIVNRIAPEGSSENIPYYYPNDTPNGEIDIKVVSDTFLAIADKKVLSDKTELDNVFTYVKRTIKSDNLLSKTFEDRKLYNDSDSGSHTPPKFTTDLRIGMESSYIFIASPCTISIARNGETDRADEYMSNVTLRIVDEDTKNEIFRWNISDGLGNFVFDFSMESAKTMCKVYYDASYSDIKGKYEADPYAYVNVGISYNSWSLNDDDVSLSDFGISEYSGTPNIGDTISIIQTKYITPCGRLMPPIYRENGERFYNAVDGVYTDPNGGIYKFCNPYEEGRPSEHLEIFEEIKPSIRGLVDSYNLRIDQIADIAFDENDNNETIETENSIEYKHPYFFVKLRKTIAHYEGSDYPFNLFDCAIEGKPMNINFTTGSCAGHVFEVAVDLSENKYNTVQVEEQTNELLRYTDGPHKGNVICGRKGLPAVEIQKFQQDTTQRETWIALKKDNSTNNGQVMPDSKNKLVPIANGDSFVITDIKLPKAYILSAEKRLEEAAIKYMYDNNSENFNFSIDFSRIYLQNHPEVLSSINENSKFFVEYDGNKYELYADSFSYKVGENDVLPEVRVELKHKISIAKSTIQRVINEAKQNVLLQLSNLDVVNICKPHFIKKNEDDATNGTINFNKVQKLNNGATFGNFKKDISGATIDENGNSEFESIKARSSITAKEYAINRLSVTDGDQLLTEGDTIIKVSAIGNPSEKCYGLYLKKQWDGYVTSQYANNVIKGIVNTLDGRSGEFYTSWMRVNSVNPLLNYIEVVMYPDNDTPSGKNYPPCELMKIARWGNQIDKTRQSCLYFSSTEGRIVKLRNVTKPIIDESNVGISLGTVPEFLSNKYPQISAGDDYIYAKGMLYQDLLEVDYQGKPVVRPFDRGAWKEGELYYCEEVNPARKVYETSDVWYMGCKYRCAKNLTSTVPSWNNTDWGMIEGNPDFSVDFTETDLVFDPDRFKVTLAIIATLYNQDITKDILPQDVIWSRYSEDDNGNPRIQSDNAWNIRNSSAGLSIDLSTKDCDFNGYIPRTLRFTATVTLRDGMFNEIAKDSTNFEY